MGIRFIIFSFCFGYCCYISSLYNPTEYEQLKEVCAFVILCLVANSSLKYFMQISSSEAVGLFKFSVFWGLPLYILFNKSVLIEQPLDLQNDKQLLIHYGSVVMYILFILKGLYNISGVEQVAVNNPISENIIEKVDKQIKKMNGAESLMHRNSTPQAHKNTNQKNDIQTNVSNTNVIDDSVNISSNNENVSDNNSLRKVTNSRQRNVIDSSRNTSKTSLDKADKNKNESKTGRRLEL